MKFHMLMPMNEWMMLVLMKCKCQMQCLTLGCYNNSLLIQAINSINTDECWIRGLSPKGKDRLKEIIITTGGYNFSLIDLSKISDGNKCLFDMLME